MRISDWSSDVCSSDLLDQPDLDVLLGQLLAERRHEALNAGLRCDIDRAARRLRYRGHRPDEDDVASRRHAPRRLLRANQIGGQIRSEEHTSELQSLMRISYAVFCLQKKITQIK